MFDHFREHGYFGFEVFVGGGRRLDFRDQLLGAVVLHRGLVVYIGVIRRREKRRIEDFLFDRRVDFQSAADLRGELLAPIVIPRFLELLECLLDVPMICLQKGDGIVLIGHALTRSFWCGHWVSSPCVIRVLASELLDLESSRKQFARVCGVPPTLVHQTREALRVG